MRTQIVATRRRWTQPREDVTFSGVENRFGARRRLNVLQRSRLNIADDDISDRTPTPAACSSHRYATLLRGAARTSGSRQAAGLPAQIVPVGSFSPFMSNERASSREPSPISES